MGRYLQSTRRCDLLSARQRAPQSAICVTPRGVGRQVATKRLHSPNKIGRFGRQLAYLLRYDCPRKHIQR